MNLLLFIVSTYFTCCMTSDGLRSTQKIVPTDDDFPFKLSSEEALELVGQAFDKHARLLQAEQALSEKADNVTYVTGRHFLLQPSEDSIRQSLCLARPMLELSRLLVEKFNIVPGDVHKVLPRIRFDDSVCQSEASRTIGDCESTTTRQTPTCIATAVYRSIDGTCNNLLNPTWGAARRPFRRLLTPAYENGFNSPRGEGRPIPLPIPRLVSAAMGSSVSSKSTSVSLMLMQWGQFLDHDLTLTPETRLSGGGQVPCCDNGVFPTSPSANCRPIEVLGDVFYSQFGIQCFRFVRSMASSVSCGCGHLEQQNDVTSFIDASNIYGSDSTKAASLRLFQWGLMKNFGDGELGTCPLPSSQTTCPLEFLPSDSNCSTSLCLNAGDGRVTEQPGLTSMHTLWLRVHNKIALQLLFHNPTWNDEKIYQETRRIIAALNQHITYKEFLPIVLGNYTMSYFNLWALSSGYQTSYNNQINPVTPNAFSTAAFRFGHSLVPNTLTGKGVSISLSSSFNQPLITRQTGTFPSDLLKGLASTASEQQDHVLVDAIRNRLFAQGPSFNVGFDLLSLNIMRGRDHGLPPYMEFRQLCGLPVFTSFQGLNTVMPTTIVNSFQSIYNSVNDIDLFAGGLSELPNGNGILGPTFSCIVGDHFRNIKFGDRFWYEGNFQPKPFTANQLAAIRQTSLASLLCQFTSIASVQPQVMLQSTVPGNGLVSCSNFPTFNTANWIGTRK